MTTIYQIRDNLKNTIAGKEQLLAEFESATLRAGANLEAVFATKEFLKINIDELKNILAAVEKCCEKTTEASWAGVDRQGGI